MTLNIQPGTLSLQLLTSTIADGNGSVTMMINGSQYIVAKYLYEAFGNALSASGRFSHSNLYRFSSKEGHLKLRAGLLSLPLYDPNLQRWLNRDPNSEGRL